MNLEKTTPTSPNFGPGSTSTPGGSFDSGDFVEEKLRVRQTLGLTWELLRANLGLILGLTLLSYLPQVVMYGLIGDLSPSDDPSATIMTSGVMALLGLLQPVLLVCMAAAVALAVFGSLQDEEVSFGQCLGLGLSKLPNLLGQMALGGLCIGAILILCMIVLSALGFNGRGIESMGLSIFIIIFLMIFLMFWFIVSIFTSVPACALEGIGPLDSLTRSYNLTKNNRLKIFFAILAPLILKVVFTIFLQAGVLLIEGGFAIFWAKFIVYIIFDIWPTAFTLTLSSVVYYNLRSVKEGFSIAEMSSVFD
ncbi:MAG: hypothetical protein LBU12_01835 [Deltaproteobacteria bacterium]|jgi:hypothetical protein|nr:hypothetical protein [Deltaproteobacteria bacterium]